MSFLLPFSTENSIEKYLAMFLCKYIKTRFVTLFMYKMKNKRKKAQKNPDLLEVGTDFDMYLSLCKLFKLSSH